MAALQLSEGPGQCRAPVGIVATGQPNGSCVPLNPSPCCESSAMRHTVPTKATKSPAVCGQLVVDFCLAWLGCRRIPAMLRPRATSEHAKIFSSHIASHACKRHASSSSRRSSSFEGSDRHQSKSCRQLRRSRRPSLRSAFAPGFRRETALACSQALQQPRLSTIVFDFLCCSRLMAIH